MASIYESPGQQVALTGSQTSPSFQPIPAYDPSRMMLAQSERDLQAFSTFSESLTKFITDKAKEKNEQEYQLGLAEVLNGTATLTPEQSDQFQAKTILLQNAAEADNQVVKEFEDRGQLDVAQQFKSDSKAISGWRAYGRAVGQAKKVAADSQAFFITWMENKENKIIPTKDGRLISPAEASTPEEIQAALEIGQQTLISQSGIKSINPVILAEHLAPSIQAVRGQIFSNKLSSEVRKQKETAISDTIGETRSEFSNPNLTVENMFDTFQAKVSKLVIDGDMSRGVASDTVIKEALGTIATMPKELAEDMLVKLGEVRKIANDPNSISLGSAYAEDFVKTLDIIEDRQAQVEAKLERDKDNQAEQAYNILTKARQDATMSTGELQQLTKQTIDLLGQIGSTKALSFRTELLAEPPNVDYTLYRQYREGISRGLKPTEDQIQKDVQAGRLSVEMGRELGVFATKSDKEGFYKQFGSSIKDAVKAKLKNEGAISLNPYNQPDKHVLHVEQITNDLTQNVYKWWSAQKAKGNTPDDNDINQFVLNQLPATIGNYFQYKKDTNEWIPRPISRNPELTPDRISSSLKGSIPDAAGFNPRTIQLRSYSSGNTRMLSSAEVNNSIQQLQNGRPVSPRVQQLADANGGIINLLTQQAQHNKLDTAPILALPQAQQQQQYRTAAPWATQRLNATSGNYFQQMLQIQRIVEAQARSQRRQVEFGNGVDLKPGTQVGMKEYLQLAIQNGLNPEQAILMAAVGMAESTGNSGVRNNNPKTGDDSYGLWQINMIGDLGPARLRQFGLRNAEDLKDPETNARVMAQMFKSGGPTAWGAYNDRRYLQYMGDARRLYSQLKSQNFNSARSGGRANFTPQNVQSIRIETPGKSFQPGIDLWFADKQFGAVLPGRVKEIRRNYGNYGNMIVVESTDTQTGEPVDVIYAHLDSINVQEGERINPGTIIGKQGGTGRVESTDGTIASIDFLAPAPKGSTSMKPYRRWKNLAQDIKQRIELGNF